MKILWLTPSDMVTEQYHGSLTYLDYEPNYYWYDKHSSPPDQGMLSVVDQLRPDIVLYISQAGGPWCASPDTFRRIRDKAPLAHLCLDAFDIGFDPLLTEYREKGCFTFTVACDGGAHNPANVDWIGFHPVDPRPYAKQKPVLERPILLGTCGGFPYGLRKEVFDRLVKNCGMVVKPREEVYGSYQRYANFLMQCQIVLDCALSAGGHNGQGPYARTLKTRAVEVGLAGACLLELRGSALKNKAREGWDFMTYETAKEAEELVQHILDISRMPIVDYFHRQDAGRRLQTIVHEKMNPEIFWNTVFERALA